MPALPLLAQAGVLILQIIAPTAQHHGHGVSQVALRTTPPVRILEMFVMLLQEHIRLL